MYIVTKEQIEENRKKYKSKEDYLEQMKKNFISKKTDVKPYTIDDIRESLIRNINYILKYNLIPKEYINNPIDYINSLNEEKLKEFDKLYDKKSIEDLKEMVKKELIVPFN